MMQQSNEYWHQVGINNCLDWRLILNGQELSHSDAS